MRFLPAIAGFAILFACDRPVPTGEPSGPVASGRADSNNIVSGGEAKAVEAGDLPSPGPQPRFIGNWAANEKSCQSAAWKFTATNLLTPAGSSCKFEQVTEVPGGYDVRAICTAEAPPAADTLKIRFAESAKAMLFDSKTIASAGLIYCGRDV